MLKKKNITKSKMSRHLLKLLKMRDYKYKEREFKNYHLRQILQNDFYIGNLRFGDLQNKHKYDTIISKRLFNLVNSKIVS